MRVFVVCMCVRVFFMFVCVNECMCSCMYASVHMGKKYEVVHSLRKEGVFASSVCVCVKESEQM